ncbi:hypothetical protein [Nocardioides sp.]|uniref:hypothetical protein n=1 Tax=Nocardioides sp. TaxID=35761 RepID=UPI002F42F0A1
MRTTLLTGGVLVVAAVVLVLLSSSLGLDVESVALMGASSGAVIALVPHRSPQWRLIGFLVGFSASWLAYLLRAGFLPDTAAGHAIAVGLVVAICSLAAALSRDRIPLWSTLLGAAVLTGSYETTYIEAPSQVLSTSLSTSTSVLLAVAFGFFAAALVAPQNTESDERVDGNPTPPPPPPSTTSEGQPAEETRLGEMMRGDAR